MTANKVIKLNLPDAYKQVKVVYILGQKVYKHYKKDIYISPDADSHVGGKWKAAKSIEKLRSKKTRLGTYNEKLERIND